MTTIDLTLIGTIPLRPPGVDQSTLLRWASEGQVRTLSKHLSPLTLDQLDALLVNLAFETRCQEEFYPLIEIELQSRLPIALPAISMVPRSSNSRLFTIESPSKTCRELRGLVQELSGRNCAGFLRMAIQRYNFAPDVWYGDDLFNCSDYSFVEMYVRCCCRDREKMDRLYRSLLSWCPRKEIAAAEELLQPHITPGLVPYAIDEDDDYTLE